eukprot:1133018-Rhodomonas_salina.1
MSEAYAHMSDAYAHMSDAYAHIQKDIHDRGMYTHMHTQQPRHACTHDARMCMRRVLDMGLGPPIFWWEKQTSHSAEMKARRRTHLVLVDVRLDVGDMLFQLLDLVVQLSSPPSSQQHANFHASATLTTRVSETLKVFRLQLPQASRRP